MSGVRSSWLIEERKSLLAALPASAAARASRSSSARRTSSVRSQIVLTIPPSAVRRSMTRRLRPSRMRTSNVVVWSWRRRARRSSRKRVARGLVGKVDVADPGVEQLLVRLADERARERLAEEASIHAVAENQPIVVVEERKGVLDAVDGARQAVGGAASRRPPFACAR